MVLFHRLRLIWKTTKPFNVNSLLTNVGIKLFATEAQVINKPTVRSLYGKKRGKKEIDAAALCMLMIPVTTFSLGVWQVFRKIEKNEMIAELKDKSDRPPVDFPKDLSALKDMEFQAVRVKGKFDHSQEIYIGPRPINNTKNESTSSLISTPKAGFLVITPFTLSDRNLTILVNRGWIPAQKKSPNSRKEGQITEEVELIGLVKLTEKRPPLGMKNHPEKGFWIYRDLEEMSKVTKASPILIEAVESSSVPGGPVGGQTVVTLKDDHLTYIFTWFGMSILTGWMWYNRYIRKITTARGLVF